MPTLPILPLLLSLALLTPPSPPPDPAGALPPDAGVYAYILAPLPGEAPAAPGETWLVEAHVYATIDAPTLVTVTLDLDDRLWVERYAAAGIAIEAGPARCAGVGPVVCTVPVRRWQPAVVVAEVRLPGGAWPCGDLALTATAVADGTPSATVTRTRPVAGGAACTTVALPYVEAP